MTLVDTSVWIDYFKDTPTKEVAWLDARLDVEALATLDLVLCECLQGVRSENEAELVLNYLGRLATFETDRSLAIQSAKNYRYLRSRGITIRSTIDCLIATFCIESGVSLLHRDRDYTAFETLLGLEVIHP